MTGPAKRSPGVVLLGGAHGSLAVARSLGRRGVSVGLLAAPNSVAALSRFTTPVIPWLGPAESSPIDRLVESGQLNGLQGRLLLPGDDFGVRLIAEHRSRLQSHFTLQTLDWDTLARLNDKGRLSGLAAGLGLDTPQTYPIDTAPDALTYPVVIKPSLNRTPNALTRAKAWRCDDPQQYDIRRSEAIDLMGPDGFVVQQHIPGGGDVQYSYAGFWDDGREIAGMTALRLRQYPLEFGVSPYVVQADLPRAAAAARSLLSAVGYHGLAEVEFKLDRRDDRLKLIDVNTRIWAWIGLGEACGVDFAGLAYRHATGIALDPPTGAKRRATAWRRHVPAMLSLLQERRRHGAVGPIAWRSVLSPARGGVFALDDPLPGLAEVPLKIAELLRPAR